MALIKMAYRVALDHGRIKLNPVYAIKQKTEHNECIVEITDEQERRLRDVIQKSYSEHMPEFEIGL
jgi:hypothetical protein